MKYIVSRCWPLFSVVVCQFIQCLSKCINLFPRDDGCARLRDVRSLTLFVCIAGEDFLKTFLPSMSSDTLRYDPFFNTFGLDTSCTPELLSTGETNTLSLVHCVVEDDNDKKD